MSFKDLENEIANFIDYYNNVRIQEKIKLNDYIKVQKYFIIEKKYNF